MYGPYLAFYYYLIVLCHCFRVQAVFMLTKVAIRRCMPSLTSLCSQ